jgi:hypothetical protein
VSPNSASANQALPVYTLEILIDVSALIRKFLQGESNKLSLA